NRGAYLSFPILSNSSMASALTLLSGSPSAMAKTLSSFSSDSGRESRWVRVLAKANSRIDEKSSFNASKKDPPCPCQKGSCWKDCPKLRIWQSPLETLQLVFQNVA